MHVAQFCLLTSTKTHHKDINVAFSKSKTRKGYQYYTKRDYKK